ncbi:MAG: DUF3568 family protein [Thermodesulfobacteriales bacterium]|nr:MAG: DUF3568 family protein [Thermodesulfobacteriales bacterium]
MLKGGKIVKKKYQKLTLVLLLLASPVVLTGCLAAAAVGGGAVAGAGTIAWIQGELKSTEGYPFAKVWAATVKTIEQLDFIVVNKVSDAISGEIDSVTADNKKVKIQVKRVGDNITEIKIRVDTFGDETLSRYILNKIQSNI